MNTHEINDGPRRVFSFSAVPDCWHTEWDQLVAAAGRLGFEAACWDAAADALDIIATFHNPSRAALWHALAAGEDAAGHRLGCGVADRVVEAAGFTGGITK